MTSKITRLILFAFLAIAAVTPRIWALDVEEAPFETAGTATIVSISTSAWTLVPATGGGISVLKGRAGIYVNNPAANTAAMGGLLTTLTPGATTIRPIEIAKGTNRFIEAGPNMKLYLISLHTSAESAHVLELGK